jgi:hypothetical protein
MSQSPHVSVEDQSTVLAALSFSLNAARSGFQWLRALHDIGLQTYTAKTRIRVSPVSDEWLLVQADEEAKHREDL